MGIKKSIYYYFNRIYPVLFADAAGVEQVPGPREPERSALEVAVREHVREAERVEVRFGEDLEKPLDAVVARREAVVGTHRVRVHLDPLDDELHAIRVAVIVEVWRTQRAPLGTGVRRQVATRRPVDDHAAHQGQQGRTREMWGQ